MATAGLIYEGKCYLANDPSLTLHKVLDSQFPIFVGSGSTLNGYYLNTSSLNSSGQYVFSVKNSAGAVISPVTKTVFLSTCDYDVLGFNPLNVSTYGQEDIIILAVLFLSSIIGLISGISWGKK